MPFTRETMLDQLNADHFDLIMSSMAWTPSRSQKMLFTDACLDLTPSLLVADYRRRGFDTHKEVVGLEELTIGVTNDPYIIARVKEFFPQADVVVINSVRAFLEGEYPHVDVMAAPAEKSFAWTLLYPDYAVVRPFPQLIRSPTGYPVARHDRELAEYVNRWIDLKRKDNGIQNAYEHWVLGRTAEAKLPRWSIIRDVLHWID